MPDENTQDSADAAALLAAAQVQTPPTPEPVVEAASPDLMSEFRSRFSGLPEDVTLDTFADHYLSIQTRAQEAETLKAEMAQYKASLALAAQQKPEPPVVEESELPWKPVPVDPALKSLCNADPATGEWTPKNPASMTAIKAAEELNNHAAYAQRFLGDLLNDPVEVTGKLTRKQFAQMKAEFKAELDEFKKQYAPMQEQVASQEYERKMVKFSNDNYAKLYAAEGGLTPLGEAVNELITEDGMDPAKALERAEKQMARFLGTTTPVQQPAKPLTLAKVAPQRFADKARVLQPTNTGERQAFDGGKGKFRKTFRDLLEENGISEN